MTLSNLGDDQEMGGKNSDESPKLRDKLDEQLFALDEPRLGLFVRLRCSNSSRPNPSSRR
jgi:hypothetical protein